MLTEAEKTWLKEREQLPSLNGDGGYFCKYCCHAIFAHGEFCCDTAPEEREEENLGYCPTAYFREDSFFQVALFKDAAEFEARVSLLMAQKDGAWEPCYHSHCTENADTVADCMACRLKQARLAVEAEMEEGAAHEE